MFEKVYGPAMAARLAGHFEFPAPPSPAASAETVAPRVEAIFTSWGMPRLDEAFLGRWPKLKVVFYGAGSVRGFVTPASWARGVRIVSATDANAVPAAEYAFAQIILSLKQTWAQASAMRAERAYVRSPDNVAGTYGSTVGLLALGRIGRRVAERLKTLAVRVIAYDPVIDPALAATLNVELCSLDDVFVQADVVSCHLPLLPETRRMIRAAHFNAMKRSAVFINTARGEVIEEPEMISVLRARPDLSAVIDVTHPEPPAAGSPLYTLPNVLLTPHIAGCVGQECRRLGEAIVAEAERYAQGLPMASEVTEQTAATAA